jgi:hypothetical protein
MSILTVQCADIVCLRGAGASSLLAAIRRRLAWLTRWCQRRPEMVDPMRSLITRVRIQMNAGTSRKYLICGKLHWFQDQEQIADLERSIQARLGVPPAGRQSREEKLPGRAFPDRTRENLVDPFKEFASPLPSSGGELPCKVPLPAAEKTFEPLLSGAEELFVPPTPGVGVEA